MNQNETIIDLKKRLLYIANKYKLGHLGSYLSSLSIINDIYASKMKKNDIFILSSGHAALALYVVLEKYKGLDAEKLFIKHGGHPHRDEKDFIHCSTGSLGLGITIALGRAVAKKKGRVHVLISDGECAEGSVWEALKTIQEHDIKNIRVYVNVNGYAAYKTVNKDYLRKRLKAFYSKVNIVNTTVEQFPFLKGLNAHYHVMSEENYNHAIKQLENEKAVC